MTSRLERANEIVLPFAALWMGPNMFAEHLEHAVIGADRTG
jgi:hypothetical protein